MRSWQVLLQFNLKSICKGRLVAMFLESFKTFYHKRIPGGLRHLISNKDFVNRLPKGQFEVVHPFQIRDKNDRIGIDTRQEFDLAAYS